LLLPLTSYINLNGAVKDATDPFELAHDMFGVFNNLEMFKSNPAFIFQLGSLTSNVSAGNKQKRNSLSEFDLSNTFCMDIETNQLDSDGNGKLLDEGIPNDILNSNVSSFIVDFGNKNQNMFQNIQLSTDEFANTEESIFTQVNLTSDSGNIAQLSTGKLFTAMENRSYSCTVTSLGNASIQPLTYFYVKNVPLFYGTYWITNVSHKITPNNMTTTFKGVRQPIAKKPTANTTVLQQLFKKAEAAVVASGGISNDQRINGATFGPVFAANNRDSPADATDNGFGLFAQESVQKPGLFVNYSGQWIAAAYLKLMTKGDKSNMLLIKALIAYLYSNASTLINEINATTNSANGVIDPPSPATAVKYFADIIVYDLYNKIDTNNIDIKKNGATSVSISKLLGNYDTKNSDYEEILSEFQQKNDTEALEYLKHDKAITGVKTTLITSDTGGVVANDAAKAKISYPDDIEGIPATDTSNFIGAAYWVSGKKENNFIELQGFNRYQLTNELYNTTKPGNSANPFIPDFELTSFTLDSGVSTIDLNSKYFIIVKFSNSPNGNYTPEIVQPNNNLTINPNINPNANLNPVTANLNNINTTNTSLSTPLPGNPNYIDPYFNNNPWGSSIFNPVPTNYTAPTLKYGIREKFVVLTTTTTQSLEFVIGQQNYEKYKSYGHIEIELYTPYKTSDGYPKQVITEWKYKRIGTKKYDFNPTNATSQNTTNIPVVLGFGDVNGGGESKTYSTNNGKFTYGKSFSNKYNRGGNDYLANVLGAIKNGNNSYVSFLSIRLWDEKAKFLKDRTVRSYIDLNVLGNNVDKKAWTIENKNIDLSNLYIQQPPAGNNAAGNNAAGNNRRSSQRRTTTRTKNVSQLTGQALNNAMYIKNYLKGKGFSKEEVAGTLGNMMTETGGSFDPEITNGRDVNRLISVGLIQWNSINFNKTNKQGVLNKIGYTVQAQLDYLTAGGWKNKTNQFREDFKKEIQNQNPTLKISQTKGKAEGLSEGEFNAYKAGYFFAQSVEICNNCNQGFESYHETITKTVGTDKYTIKAFERSGYAVDFYKRMNDVNDPLKWESTASSAQPTSSSAQPTSSSAQSTSQDVVTIGDSISILINKIYPNIKLIPNLSESGKPASWLLGQLEKINNTISAPLYVILSIGSNNLWKLDSDGVDKKLIEKIKEVFPSANLYILNGSYGWLNLTGGSDKDWEDKINKYTSFYEDKGFNIIGDVSKLTTHPRQDDNLLKSFNRNMKALKII
jgi:hypothetical protein